MATINPQTGLPFEENVNPFTNQQVAQPNAEILQADFLSSYANRPTPPATTGGTPVAPVAPEAPATAGDVYGDYMPKTNRDLENAYSQYGAMINADTAPVNEEDIRLKTMARFQEEIDALNRVYATKRAEEQVAGQGRLGQSRAIQARRGLLGSDFGVAQTATTSDYNQRIQNSIEAERAAKIGSILSTVRKETADEFTAKTAARKLGAQEYINFLADAETRKISRVTDTVGNVIASGVEADPEMLKELASQLGVTEKQLMAEYNRQQADKTALEAKNKPKAETFVVNNVLYEKQTDGSYKAVTPETADKATELQFISGNKTQPAGYFNKITGDFTTLDGAKSKGTVSSSGDFIDYGFTSTPQPTSQSTPSQPKQTFAEFLTQEQNTAGQSFAPNKVAELRKEYDANQAVVEAKPTPIAQDADLSKYSFEVRQVILGNQPATDILSGGTAAERARFRKELDDAQKNGLLQQTTSEYQRKAISDVNNSVAKSSTYAKTVSMQNYANNVQAALSLSTGVGDIAAINQFQKVVDEGAVTRDQDVKLIQESQSLLNTLNTKVSKLQKGEQLSPELRSQMNAAINALYNAQIKALEKDPYIKSKKKELETKGIDPIDTIFGELGSFQSSSDSTIGTTPSGISYTITK